MPTPTSKLGIQKPLGNETVTRQSFNTNWDIIDQNAASQAQVDEPFYLKSASYDQPNNRLVLTLGRGQAAFLNTLVSKATDSTHYITGPAVSTTYHLYLRSDGTFTHNATGGTVAGAVRLWTITTGAALTDPLTSSDVRGRLPGAGARVVQDNLDAHTAAANPHSQYAQVSTLSAHTGDTGNPHGVTAAQVGAIASVDGISNPGGNVDLQASGAISLTPDNVGKKVTIGESHSGRTDNPHATTAAQVGALVSLDGVGNPGGNVDLVAAGAVQITPDDVGNSITIGESHSGRTDNPHGTTAAQVGAIPAQSAAVTDTYIGNRTVNDTTVPSSDTAQLTTMLSGIVNRLKTITGEASWRTGPAAAISAIWAKFSGATGHKHTGGSDDGAQVAHGSLTGVSADQHHPKSHNHSTDGSGTVAHGSLSGLSNADEHPRYVQRGSASLTQPKKIFVQSGDPGGAAVDGDVWVQG